MEYWTAADYPLLRQKDTVHDTAIKLIALRWASDGKFRRRLASYNPNQEALQS